MRRPHSVGCIVTRYGLYGPGMRHSVPVQPGHDDHPASCKMRTGPFPVEKRPERDAGHPSPSSAEAANELQLYLHLPSVPACACHARSWNTSVPSSFSLHILNSSPLQPTH
jgi:hypothetical protein